MSENLAMNATYRVQLTKDFTLRDVAALADYFQALGISHLYLSPVFSSTPGSLHGYDGIDFNAISEERGGEEGLRALDRRMQEKGMKLLLDIVPNHMAADTTNPYWYDVLAKGPNSEFWGFFDMRLVEGKKIRLPVLGDGLERLVRQGDIKLTGLGNKIEVQYYDTIFPLRRESVTALEGKDIENFPADKMLQLLSEQHYELADWREVSDNVSYRRFFDVSGLIGLRVEDENVYAQTHRKLFEILKAMPSIDGVRVDHIDGLADPGAYLELLKQNIDHIWVEKILSPGETMVADWPVMGTSGYEFTQNLNQLLIDREGFAGIEKFWRENVQDKWSDFGDCVRQSKELVLDRLFSAERERLVNLLAMDEADKDDARKFWTGLTVGLPIYRIYYQEGGLTEDDRNWINEACRRAREWDIDFEGLEKQYLPRLLSAETPEVKQALREWAQLSGPAMAKGLEDTSHYRYTPLAALNEVGCGPELEENGADTFYRFINERVKSYPYGLNTTSTHDTKRSEDARHRLYALAEMPREWAGFYRAAATINNKYKADVDRKSVPGPETEYFLYQAILCAWPLDDEEKDGFKSRLQQYMEKSLREAKLETNATENNTAYENAVKEFVAAVLQDDEFAGLAKDFVQRLILCGAATSLTVMALKILSPGVPDIY
ncbi:MAG: treY, partial [Alphaproteobacteria bacterium]|nr:treY [Alphaproteobacteria bacterium]